MRLRLATSAWWIQGMVYGTFFGAIMTLFAYWRTGDWPAAFIGGAVGGVFFGVSMGLLATRTRQRALAGLEDLALEELRIVLRAAGRGPAPSDGRLRDATRTLVERRQTEALRQRRWTIPIFALATLLYVWLGVSGNRWWWLAGVAFLGVAVLSWFLPSLIARRLRKLESS